MVDKRFKQFYSFLFITAFLAYFPYIFPFLPNQIFGFNLTGFTWVIMLLVTLINLVGIQRISFPLWAWMPFIIYLAVYIILDFSFLGLQLTLQYLLPLLVGIVASGFTYSKAELKWMFLWFIRLCVAIIILFFIGYFFRGGYTANTAATPMLLSIAAALFVGIYFITDTKKYLLGFGLLFLVPLLDLTRMGIAVFGVIFVIHFANKKIFNKIIYGLVGCVIALIIFNTKGFQEKTFYQGKGNLSELTTNFSDNKIDDSGRSFLYKVMQKGIKDAPFFGNGPRSDMNVLLKKTNNRTSEAHSDYLSMRYNYGYLGLGSLLYGFIASFILVWQIKKQSKNNYTYLLSTSVLTLFIGFLMFMYSDNILKYTVFFPNIFFALTGIVFSIHKFGFALKER